MPWSQARLVAEVDSRGCVNSAIARWSRSWPAVALLAAGGFFGVMQYLGRHHAVRTDDLRAALAHASTNCNCSTLRQVVAQTPLGELFDQIAAVDAELLGNARDLVARELHARQDKVLALWRHEPSRRQHRAAAFALAFRFEPRFLFERHADGDTDERAAVLAAARFLPPDEFRSGAGFEPRWQSTADALFAAALAGQRAQQPRWRTALEAADDRSLANLLRSNDGWFDPIGFAELLADPDHRVRARAIFAACRLRHGALPLGVADAVLPLGNPEMRSWLADLAASHRGFRAGDVSALLAQFAGALDVPWHLVAATDSLVGEPLERLADGLFADLPPLRIAIADLQADLGSATPFLIRTRDVGLLRTLFVASLGDTGYRLVVRRAAAAPPAVVAVYLAGLYLAPLPSSEAVTEASALAARHVGARDGSAAGSARLLAQRCAADPRLPATAHDGLQRAFTAQRLPALPDRPSPVVVWPERIEAEYAAGGERAAAAWRELHAAWQRRPAHVLDLVQQGWLRRDLAASAIGETSLTLLELTTLVPAWTEQLSLHAAPLAKACDRGRTGDPAADLAALRVLADGAPWPFRVAVARRAATLGPDGRAFAAALLAGLLAEPDQAAWRAAAGRMLAEGMAPENPAALADALRQAPQQWNDPTLALAVLVRFAGLPLATVDRARQFDVALQSGVPLDVATWRDVLAGMSPDRLPSLYARHPNHAHPLPIRLAALDVAVAGAGSRHLWPPIHSLLADPEPAIRLAAYRALQRGARDTDASAWLPYAAVFDPDPEVRAFGESLSR
jgi:hypothetical protein